MLLLGNRILFCLLRNAPAMSPQEQLQIEELLSAGELQQAFSVIGTFSTLKQSEIPSLSKDILLRLETTDGMSHQFVLGLMSPSVSVRRFCRKYLPKLGNSAAKFLYFHLIEALDPFRPVLRPQDGLAGSYAGFASPIAQHIIEEEYSLTPLRNSQYAEAHRYAMDCIEMMASTLIAIRPDLGFLLEEYLIGVAQLPIEQTFQANSGRDRQTLQFYRQALEETLEPAWWGLIKKNDAQAVKAAQTWKQHQWLIDAEPWSQETILKPVRPLYSRFNAYQALIFQQLEEKSKLALQGVSHTTAQETRPKVKPLAAVKKPALPQLPGVAAVPAGPAIKLLTNRLKLFIDVLKTQIGRKKGGRARFLDLTKISLPESEVRTDLRKYLAQPRPRDFISELDLAKAPWANDFLKLLIETAKPQAAKVKHRRGNKTLPAWSDFSEFRDFFFEVTWDLEQLNYVAGMFLPETQLETWVEFWRTEVGLYGPTFDLWPPLLEIREQRGILADSFFSPWLKTGADQPNAQLEFQLLLARLYQRPEPIAHELVRDAIQNLPLPTGKENDRRKEWHEPYCWLINTAWKRHDALLLAAAFERSAIPFLKKCEQPFIPVITEFTKPKSGSAPKTPETRDALKLKEVWTFVCDQVPERISKIIDSLVRTIEVEELPRLLLPIAAETVSQEHFTPVANRLLAHSRSTQPAVGTLVFEIIETAPGVFEGCFEETLKAVLAGVASPSIGTAKAAAAAMCSMIRHFRLQHPEPLMLAFDQAILVETPTVLEQLLKGLQRLPIAGLPRTTHNRLAELADRDEKRFGKFLSAAS